MILTTRQGHQTAQRRQRRSVFAAVDGEFGTIGFGEPGFVLETRWNRSITNHPGVAQFVERKQFRGERMTPSMSLAALLIDAHLQRS